MQLRRVPYPYRSVLAICSDLDETPDRRVYAESARFLNTTGSTCMGPGVGLEVGNTIYFDMPQEQFSYWNTDDTGRDMIRTLIRSGHIDCLHSFGDLASTRGHAGKALEELVRHDCQLRVWIDHATAPTNFGSDIMRGSGDVQGHPAYHADLTCDFGVRYVWRGRVTSVIGQGVTRSLSGIFDGRHPVSSSMTAGKELVKGVLGQRGDAKYRAHYANAVCYEARLRDGRPVVEFLRANPHFEGVSGGDTAVGLPDVLTPRLIDRLAAREAFCILYTHLGKVADPGEPFGSRTRESLRQLAARQAAGDVLVTTTRRLLDYVEMSRRVRVSAEDGPVTTLRVDLPDTVTIAQALPPELEGLTVYLPRPTEVRLVLNGREVTTTLQLNPSDETGRVSVSVPWRRLSFPSFI